MHIKRMISIDKNYEQHVGKLFLITTQQSAGDLLNKSYNDSNRKLHQLYGHISNSGTANTIRTQTAQQGPAILRTKTSKRTKLTTNINA